MEALTRLHITVSKAYKINPEMNFEVFIHKVDGLSDDHKIETQRDVHQRANDDLADAGLEKLHLRRVALPASEWRLPGASWAGEQRKPCRGAGQAGLGFCSASKPPPKAPHAPLNDLP